ncbi:MAG: RHS repeat-associated core domain-containing protein [Verrucomicrobia bacterium]|nr:RHS repeat-associated core domain-containing protein [Verrucomicrobiota bacterium]
METTLTRDYDPQGRPTGFTLGNAYTVEYDYTDQGRFHSVAYNNNQQPLPQNPITAIYSYTANSHMIFGYTLGDLTRSVTLENNRNLIDTVSNTWDTTLISRFDYTNDKAGRRTARGDSGAAFTSTQNNTFGYNDRNEVTTATMRNGESTYNFDQIGNRVLADVPTPLFSPGGVFDYTTNALNQYTSIASTPSTPSTLTHDDDGNLTNDGKGLTLKWNGENRMIRVEKGDMVMLNTFDGQGRRVRKQVFDDGTPVEDHRYFYDGWNLIYEIDVLAAAEPTYYVWGLDLSQSLQGAGGVGGLLMVHNDGATWAPTYDTNGNISEYINLANGGIDAHLEYDAFGRIIASTGTAPSNFGFSTKYEDVETGYLYYGFRFYDPVTGRWPNRDPIGERGGVNLCAFVRNDGVNAWDYLGFKGSKKFLVPIYSQWETVTEFTDYDAEHRRETGASRTVVSGELIYKGSDNCCYRQKYCGRVVGVQYGYEYEILRKRLGVEFDEPTWLSVTGLPKVPKNKVEVIDFILSKIADKGLRYFEDKVIEMNARRWTEFSFAKTIEYNEAEWEITEEDFPCGPSERLKTSNCSSYGILTRYPGDIRDKAGNNVGHHLHREFINTKNWTRND